jgi:hypothetical protein
VTDGYVVGSAIGRCGSMYLGNQTTFGNPDPTKNGRTLLGSIVLPLFVRGDGSSSALRVEVKHRVPLVLAPSNVPISAVNVQVVVGSRNYYGAPDVTRCQTTDLRGLSTPSRSGSR